MKKIISLFMRDYESNRQIYDEVVPGAEWVVAGEGIPTAKHDGTACMVRDGLLFKRYNRKGKQGRIKDAPLGWEPCEVAPDENTGHWPGWVPVDCTRPENKWYNEAITNPPVAIVDGTYELVGPKVQGNPYKLTRHYLWRHGITSGWEKTPPRDFEGLREWFSGLIVEGIVWHHQDGRMVKIKRRDFGLAWPDSTSA